MTWRTVREAPPSLVEHYVDDSHTMSAQCWCRPFMRHAHHSTTVVHNASRSAALASWPFSSQVIMR